MKQKRVKQQIVGGLTIETFSFGRALNLHTYN